MKRISLTKGQFAIVDDANYDWLNQWKWCAQWNKYTQSFYAIRGKRLNGKNHIVSMAREILGLKDGDKRQADHTDHNTLDNRILNLQIVTHQQNSFNQRNTKGYYWHKDRNKYLAQIMLNGKQIHLGYFYQAKEASKAYLDAKEQYHTIDTR